MSTPPSINRGQHRPSVDTKGRIGPNVHAGVHALSTPGCGRQKPHISAALNPLSTLSTPYKINNYIERKMGVATPVLRRLPVSSRGVDTLGVDRHRRTPLS